MRTAFGSALRNMGCNWGLDEVLSTDGRAEDEGSNDGLDGMRSRDGREGLRLREGLDADMESFRSRSMEGRTGSGRCSY